MEDGCLFPFSTVWVIENIKDISGKGKIEAEILISKAKREKIFYELGKAVASSSKSREKKIIQLRKQLSDLNRIIKRNERVLKIKP